MRRRFTLRAWAADRDGVAAVEFALIAPVMIVLYFGMCEFCQAYMAHKRMGHVASTVADIVARTTDIKADQLDDIFAAGPIIMKPYSSAALSTRVSSVTRDDKGVARIDWTRAKGSNTTVRKKGDTVVVPADVIANGESLIMSETAYDFNSPVDFVMPDATRFKQVYYLRPRTVSKIGCSDC
ncbi:MAG: pilus assembly protein [Brevundimonas sp.]|uniref:TadE/TadG family type IV pilus assembly protein n=1 Tax=Brevundimonas sp. TaxID=1871086 RepID=UPI00120177E0|nr:TadE/TadG family type IV pilus assembly protein [Brevundimonas sp.]RZJ17675.1 MAG: pilus assembly protein [Brevundimonas sp.]